MWAQARIALQITQIGLEIHRNASVHAKQTRCGQTYLVAAGCAQVSQANSSTMKTCRGHAYMLTALPTNTSETANLPARGAESRIDEPLRLGSQADALGTHKHVQSNANSLKIPANASETIRTNQNSWNPPHSPGESTGLRTEVSKAQKRHRYVGHT